MPSSEFQGGSKKVGSRKTTVATRTSPSRNNEWRDQPPWVSSAAGRWVEGAARLVSYWLERGLDSTASYDERLAISIRSHTPATGVALRSAGGQGSNRGPG